MELALFNLNGFQFILRWFHLFFGVTWIGLLYYFNFVQGAFFNETDAATKSNAIQKLVPRALWWFRWAAIFTFLTGWTMISIRGAQLKGSFLETSWGVNILIGAIIGSLMWANVWFIIWPNQKIVIASATQAASGKGPIAEAANAGARAIVASRTNTMFSIAMLFFMGSASHLNIAITASSLLPLFGTFAVILGALELNAIKGKAGPLTSVKGVIHAGFGLTIVLYLLLEFLAR